MNPSNAQFLCRSMTGCGKHALEHLPLELAAVGAKKPLVITSKAISTSKRTTHVINAFKESGLTIGMVNSITASAGIDTVEELTTIYQDKGFDAILALGGPSVANVAKVLNLAVSKTDGNLKTLAGANKLNRPLNPLFYLPSGPGSGFETAGEARVDSLKFSSMFLMPDRVIIDPRLMAADIFLPLAAQAMATLACCAEALCTTTNPLVRAYASTGVTLVMDNIEPALAPLFAPAQTRKFFPRAKAPNSELTALATAAAISGYLWSNCPDLLTVGLGRALGSLCPTAPGLLMGVLLPTVIEYRHFQQPEPGAAQTDAMDRLLLALAGLDCYCTTPECQRFDLALARIRQLTNTLFLDSGGAIPRTLGDADIAPVKLEHLATQWFPNQASGPDSDAPGIILAHAHAGQPIKQGGGHVPA